MHYFLTYAAMDTEIANPFWHATLILSTFDEKEQNATRKLKVQDTLGFYGVPATDRDSYFTKLKLKLKIDTDLIGNHGMLIHEELRYFDLGKGLHGTTFELTEEQWKGFQAKCNKMIEEQKAAVTEIAEFCGLDAKPRSRIYPHEHHSQLIHTIEKLRAAKEGREPRLKPFELRLNMTLSGPTVRHSKTCKSQLIELLKGTLTNEQIDRLTESNKHPTAPKHSGKMESIHLHSEGRLHKHIKNSGHVVHYRDIKDEGTSLYWTLPPQELVTSNDKTKNLLMVQPSLQIAVKNAIKKLQSIEWLLINTQAPDHLLNHKSELIRTIKDHYEAFSLIDPSAKEKEKIVQKHHLFYIFNPKVDEEDPIQKALTKAEDLLNSLYFAMVDKWEIESDEVVAMAAYLPEKDQKDLCKILKRGYDLPPKNEEPKVALVR